MAAPPRERRAFPRRDGASTVRVHRRSAGPPLTAAQAEWALRAARLKGPLVDLSMNGAAFLLPEPLRTDEELVLRLENSRFARTIDLAARVVRVSEDAGGWKAVCRFERCLTLEEVHVYSRLLSGTGLV